MSHETQLQARSGHKCELCGSTENLQEFAVDPSDGSVEQTAYICGTCQSQLDAPDTMDANHWRCLNDSMWNPNPAIQVLAYRALHLLKDQDWTQGLIDMMYMEEDTRQWAEAGLPDEDNSPDTKDSNGTILSEGDDVTLIKDLVVKGANFTAKRGTLVKNIHLTDNPKHIEGKVNGVQIVLVAAYLKKA